MSSPSQLKEISSKPADSPAGYRDTDTQVMVENFSAEDLERLWLNNMDNIMSDDQRMTLYWNHRLRCCLLVTLYRLEKYGVTPKRLLKVLKIPLYVAYSFETTYYRAWRTKAKKTRDIGIITDAPSGDRTFCDHMISHQPGLVSEQCGILTHKQFWASSLHVYYISEFIYNHLLEETTSAEPLAAKHGYERVNKSYGVKVKAYHVENLRFNDAN